MKPAVILIMIIMTMLVKMMTMSNFDLSYLALFQMAKLIDIKTRPSALGMSDPVMEFLEILETQESLSKF